MSDTQGYKLLLTYDYRPGREMAYRRFMINQWLPAMQTLGLEPMELYHTMWGEYPVRLVVMYAASAKIMHDALNSGEWEFWWRRLQRYVDNLDYCIVPARDSFQFCNDEAER
jgi:hypothetical protein